MDLPEKATPSREYYARWDAYLTQKVQECRLALGKALEERGKLAKEWWDWEQSVAKPLDPEVK